MPTSTEIRDQFIDFFVKKHGHEFVRSSSVVPHDDPTLLFTNAGMNQFKPYFLGTEKPPYKRVANSQKCIRAGGKHNDLDDVGKDTYHHTFFEMLGNWSFGDYFKREAIQWAWELLTGVWGMDKSRLHATVFEGDPAAGVARDDEAAELWRTVTDIDPAHIHFGSKKDNFWEMGDTGPCGPCTEIHIDRTPNKTGGKLVNAGTPDVIEIWNLVFIQFNRNPDKSLTQLQAKHVDTGMGFERVTAVLQNKSSNYDTDVFTPIFEAIQRITKAPPYTGKLDDRKDTAYRVIADHIRALTFALTDGAVPSNTGRGYVLRSILRRAERFGRLAFETQKPFLYELVPAVVQLMAGAFPELAKAPDRVAEVIREEENAFLRTFDRGIKIFREAVDRTRQARAKVISGDDAFDLHQTYGFFVDITEQMAQEEGLTVDRLRFNQRMEEHAVISDQGRKKVVISAVQGELPRTDDTPKYHGPTLQEKVHGWVVDSKVVTSGALSEGQEAALLFGQTNFYAEQGGQVGDTGTVLTDTGLFEVTDTQKLGDAVLHVGFVKNGTIKAHQLATLERSAVRRDTMRNHTATHLLNWALRRVLGEHVEQKGSLVDPDKTRFDFAHDKPLSPDQVAEVERLVNEEILRDLPVTPEVMPLEQARHLPGVRAVFGEKYPDPVRVLMVGAANPNEITTDHSTEFCGGTHLDRTGVIGLFKITGQEAVAKGVRRVVAVTGRRAFEAVQNLSKVVGDLSGRFNCRADEVPGRIESLQEELKKLQQQLKKGTATDLAGAADKLLAEAPGVNGTRLVIGQLPSAVGEQVLQQVDRLRQKTPSCAIVFGWTEDDKVQLLVAVTKDLNEKGVKAGDVIKPVVEVIGGKGGGRPDLARAGGKDAARLPEAFDLARKLLTEKLGGP